MFNYINNEKVSQRSIKSVGNVKAVRAAVTTILKKNLKFIFYSVMWSAVCDEPHVGLLFYMSAKGMYKEKIKLNISK